VEGGWSRVSKYIMKTTAIGHDLLESVVSGLQSQRNKALWYVCFIFRQKLRPCIQLRSCDMGFEDMKDVSSKPKGSIASRQRCRGNGKSQESRILEGGIPQTGIKEPTVQ
jgi:hypothetical protein